MKISKIIGTGGTLEDRFNEIEIIKDGIKNTFDILKSTFDYYGDDDYIFEDMCFQEIMKISKGRMNPNSVKKLLKEYLNLLTH